MKTEVEISEHWSGRTSSSFQSRSFEDDVGAFLFFFYTSHEKIKNFLLVSQFLQDFRTFLAYLWHCLKLIHSYWGCKKIFCKCYFKLKKMNLL